MKKQKVCALLCIAALSTATITPAMAADNTADAQVTTGKICRGRIGFESCNAFECQKRRELY